MSSVLRRVLVVAPLLLLALWPFWAELPTPTQATRLGSAEFLGPNGERDTVSLPHRWSARARQDEGEARYRFTLRLDEAPAEALYVFVPLLSQHAELWLDGEALRNPEPRTYAFGARSGLTRLVSLPPSRLRAGEHTLELRLRSRRLMRGYLSALYVGSEQALMPHYRLRLFLLEHLRLMVFAVQLLMSGAVLVAFLYRPGERLFRWLLALLAASGFYHIGSLATVMPALSAVAPYGYMLASAVGPILPILALLFVGRPVPRGLPWAVPALPAVSVLLGLSGLLPEPALVLFLCVPAMLLGLFGATAIAARGAFLDGNREALLFFLPLLLLCLAALRDMLAIQGAIAGPIMFSGYYRPLILAAVSVILMRRLAISLQRVDEANVHLNRRLAEREAELALVHERERLEATQRVRLTERQRLTADLHDGLSGHLASIIALAERERTGGIEQAAREALDDLRLVIHSLDIGDRDLTLALSKFHERLQRQLKRLGVELQWSIARLPEVAGVTPAHALNLLRILQEAVTNALKHGPAASISLRGMAGEQGRAVIAVENDGAPFVAREGGAGLGNMHRRAAQLGAELAIEALPRGARLLITLPATLPSIGAAPDTDNG
ncbi:sensor histidine kinase [Alkalilimnicola sp. S0819]|uniref:sensor histidine kinase n=1 Tax=Alkalilimnicola sp. S0819 TaxID=2613922 RepID=UPI0012628FD6|nr:two-component sensor histidine kinase [Alkalilimnicola sp. S0819]KAB7624070.1 two-component sensor histidine kinase [Alkalilimnicola sp. S0819]MPQ16320.1 two-component sensor histidine kinase [Alkalilimnicola sp. S0819]